jgi:hypothetical protein
VTCIASGGADADFVLTGEAPAVSIVLYSTVPQSYQADMVLTRGHCIVHCQGCSVCCAVQVCALNLCGTDTGRFYTVRRAASHDGCVTGAVGNVLVV